MENSNFIADSKLFIMANPLWKAGMQPQNPAGRPRYSVTTIKGMVERFVKRNITPNKLQRMYNTLSVKDQLQLLTELLPYTLPKQAAESLGAGDIDALYDKVMESLKTNANAQVV